MSLIIMWHYLVYGFDILNDWQNTSTEVYLTPILSFPVDCFIFISGYYGINLRRETIVKFITQLIFYSLLMYLITCSIKKCFNLKVFPTCFFPISTNAWWFFSEYFLLMILSPLLNKCNEWDKMLFKKNLLLMSVFYLGLFSFLFGQKNEFVGDFALFIYIYMLGRYFSTYPPVWIIKNRFVLLFLIVFILYVLFFTFNHFSMQSWVYRTISYNNPLILGLSVIVYFIFANRGGAKSDTQQYCINSVCVIFGDRKLL